MSASSWRKAGAAASAFTVAALLVGCASPRESLSAGDGLALEKKIGTHSDSDAGGVSAKPADDSALGMPGSDAAKDDLYCWAILGVHFDAQNIAASGEAGRFLAAQKRLEASGIARLTVEGVTVMDDWASRTVAYAVAARADYRRNRLRFSPDECLARAAELEKQAH